MPIIVLNFQVEDKYYDINVSPDKREVFLKSEAEIVRELKIKLTEFFDEIQKSKLVQNLRKKSDAYNPTLNKDDNDVLKHLQKKKVSLDGGKLTEEENKEFAKRNESGAQKTMNDFKNRFSSYKDAAKQQKRKANEVMVNSQTSNDEKFNQTVHTVKRLKTDYEKEVESESQQDEVLPVKSQKGSQSSYDTPDSQLQENNNIKPDINRSIESIARRQEELKKQMNSK